MPRFTRLQLTASLCFLIISLVWVALSLRDHFASGWILMTSPIGADHDGNPLIGYSFLHAGRPFMKENIPHVAQVGVFCGTPAALELSEYRQDFRHLRGLYSLLAALVAPLTGVIPALLLVNWLAWALCAWTAWHLTLALFHNEWGALLAVLLVSGGIGMTTHITDYSPHLLAFATYYFGVWLLLNSHVYESPQPWRIHLLIGIYLAIAALAYNTGIMLAGVYLLVAARRNQPAQWLLAAALGLSARPLLQLVFGRHILDVEAAYLREVLPQWRELLTTHGVVYIAKTLGLWLSEFLFFFDSPLIVFAGIICIWTARLGGSLRWLGCCTIAIPIAAALIFTPKANARGYLVYAGTIWMYAVIAGEAVRASRVQHQLGRWAARLILLLVLVSHFLWSSSHATGWLLPVKTYFLGWDDGLAYWQRPHILSLTGAEPTPVLLGGQSSLLDAGAIDTPPQRSFSAEQVTFASAVKYRAWYFGYFLLLALVAGRTRRIKITAGLLVVLALIISSALAAGFYRSSPAFFNVDQALILHPGEHLRYELDLRDDFLERLEQFQATAATNSLMFFVRGPSEEQSAIDAHVSIQLDGQPIPCEYQPIGKYVVSPEHHSGTWTRLRAARHLTLDIRNTSEKSITLIGWQRNQLPGRSCEVMGANGRVRSAAVLPAFELRIVGPGGTVQFAGF